VIQTKARARSQPALEPAFPAIVRPATVPHATKPADIPEPTHHHLPSWVRRAYARARPILADLLGSLEGDAHDEYAADIDALTALINSGKFSQAFQYPQLITSGVELYERQKREQAEEARARRALDTTRRRVGDRLRDAGPTLSVETVSRLSRAVKSAPDEEALVALEAEMRQAVESARTVQERRRDREISKTKTRIERRSAKASNGSDGAESWQDVLRRLHEQMAADQAS
jgi:hypothetical protein